MLGGFLKWNRSKIFFSLFIAAFVFIVTNTFAVDCANTAQTGVPESECSILVDLYNSTNGPSWNNNQYWLSNQPIGTWQGITISDGHVTELNLPYNNLSGNIPSSIGYLSQLEILNLAFNNLTGSIPTTIGNLNSLVGLDLKFNQLSGIIPITIADLSAVQTIDLRYNQLAGPIPPAIENLSQLHALILNSNQLSGPIPPTIGNIESLEYLILDNNLLTGPIPSTFANLLFLRHINLSYNALTGNIPTYFAELPYLEYLALSDTQMEGTIPPQLTNLTFLNLLWLDNNQLTGAIPSFDEDNPSLTYLNLSYNKLTGELPVSLGSLPFIFRLAVNNNKLLGTLTPAHFSSSLLLNSDNMNYPPTVSLQNNCFDSLTPELIDYMDLDGYNYFGFEPQFPRDNCKGRPRPVVLPTEKKMAPNKTELEERQKIRDSFESAIPRRYYDMEKYELIDITDSKGNLRKGEEALKYLSTQPKLEAVKK